MLLLSFCCDAPFNFFELYSTLCGAIHEMLWLYGVLMILFFLPRISHGQYYFLIPDLTPHPGLFYFLTYPGLHPGLFYFAPSGLWHSSRLKSHVSSLTTSDYWLLTTDYWLPTIDYRLLTTDQFASLRSQWRPPAHSSSLPPHTQLALLQNWLWKWPISHPD